MSRASFDVAGLPHLTPRTTNLVYPLVAITSCIHLPKWQNSSSYDCGPVVAGRTVFNNDWCARKADLAADGGGWPVLPARFDSVLSGAVLDVAIIPGSDDVLWIDDAAGGRLGRRRR